MRHSNYIALFSKCRATPVWSDWNNFLIENVKKTLQTSAYQTAVQKHTREILNTPNWKCLLARRATVFDGNGFARNERAKTPRRLNCSRFVNFRRLITRFTVKIRRINLASVTSRRLKRDVFTSLSSSITAIEPKKKKVTVVFSRDARRQYNATAVVQYRH